MVRDNDETSLQRKRTNPWQNRIVFMAAALGTYAAITHGREIKKQIQEAISGLPQIYDELLERKGQFAYLPVLTAENPEPANDLFESLSQKRGGARFKVNTAQVEYTLGSDRIFLENTAEVSEARVRGFSVVLTREAIVSGLDSGAEYYAVKLTTRTFKRPH